VKGFSGSLSKKWTQKFENTGGSGFRRHGVGSVAGGVGEVVLTNFRFSTPLFCDA
jgi:hypothetical protein